MDRKMREWKTAAAAETAAVAEELAKAARPGNVYALDGDLGSGKTVFAQGFARGLGVDEAVTSPTFTILQTYESGRLLMHHLDVYRIEDPEELSEVGLDDCLYGDGVCLIEWAARIESLLPPGTICITLSRLPEEGEDCRRIVMETL